MTQDQIIRIAQEAGFTESKQFEGICIVDQDEVNAFAALVRADLMKQVIDTCEAEYKRYDEMVEQDDAGHEESCALIHLMRKLEKLK